MQGEIRDGNIIGAEGGAQYGLTGRLAKVVGSDTLQAAGFHSEQAEFPIGPGRQTQILQLDDGLSNPEHYYLHVIGKAKNQEACTDASCADFEDLGSDVGVSAPLDTRPRYVAPVLTPHYDEEQHWLAYREYRRLLKAGEDPSQADPQQEPIDPTRPVPTYTWNHRPEYQFSRYSLEIDEINRVDIDPQTGDETRDDIYDTDTPVIGSSDDLVEMLYSLIGPEFDRLAPIDGGQDLIFAIGEHETKVELGEDNTLKFDNIDHLAGLSPEDFLSMRLYLNQDAGNVLWEFALARLTVVVDANNDGILNETSSDPEHLQYAELSPDDKARLLAQSDHTSPERPFRFWLNNDYDVVIRQNDELDILQSYLFSEESNGVKLDQVLCPVPTREDNERDQNCLGDDKVILQNSKPRANNDIAHRDHIESVRDLEDFTPLLIRIDKGTYDQLETGRLSLQLRVSSIGINIFEGLWAEDVETIPDECAGGSAASFYRTLEEERHINSRRYLEDCAVAKAQAEARHLFDLSGGGEQGGATQEILTPSRVRSLFKPDPVNGGYRANLLFEGVVSSGDLCTPQTSEDCFLDVLIRSPERGQIVSRERVYIDLQPIKAFYDHFTVGTWIECKDTFRDVDGDCQIPPDTTIPDLYTAARSVHAGEAENPANFHMGIPQLSGGQYRQPWQADYGFRQLVKPLDPEQRSSGQTDYVMQVHGWRMPYAERVFFAETSYKRLYHQGYTGRFGAFSWPTGWLHKSSNIATPVTLIQVFQDINNYSRSERIARESGPMLADKLKSLKSSHQSLHLFAHSMGNVVVSEALRYAKDQGEGELLNTYVATQAATVAGAYVPEPPLVQGDEYAGGGAMEMFVDSVGRRDLDSENALTRQTENLQEQDTSSSYFGDLTDWLISAYPPLVAADCNTFQRDFITVWRCNNVDQENFFEFDRWFDPPPDWYREQPNFLERRHPSVTPDEGYYGGIAEMVTDRKIINFYNERDAALDGWNLGQITKPDQGNISESLSPDWDHDPTLQNETSCDGQPVDCVVEDKFSALNKSGNGEPERVDLRWSDVHQRRAIVSLILPSRTYALGATAQLGEKGEVSGEFNLRTNLGMTNSDVHHSAQFLDSYTEWQGYWYALCQAFFTGSAPEDGESLTGTQQALRCHSTTEGNP